MKLRRSVSLTLTVAALLLGPRGATASEALRVVCTTTLLSTVVTGVGAEQVVVSTIVPFGMCPGHFDISPKEASALRDADLILAHGFERFLDKLAGNGRAPLPLHKVSVNGNWMVPETQKAAAGAVAALLAAQRPALAETCRANLAEYVSCVDAGVAALRPRLARLHGIPVVCSNTNETLCRWFGLDVVATVPRDEDISVQALTQVVRAARDRAVRLVIDNRQSSGKVGKTLATELGVPLIVLDNFPAATAGASAYVETLTRNGTDILNAMAPGCASAARPLPPAHE